MQLSIGYESDREGEYEALEDIPYEPSSGNIDEQFEIANKIVVLNTGEELQIDSFYIPATKGFASEIRQNGKVILHITSFDYFDVTCLTLSGTGVRLNAGNLEPENA